MKSKLRIIIYMSIAILFMTMTRPYKISAMDGNDIIKKVNGKVLITVSGNKVIDSNGNIVNDPESDGLILFSNKGKIDYKMLIHREKAFLKDVKLGYKDKSGKVIIPPKYCEAKSFYKGVAWVAVPNGKDYQNPKWGLIDKKGNYIINPQFSKVFQFADNGLAIVREWDEKNLGKYGVVNILGNVILNPKYDGINNFSEGLATVKLGKYPNEKYGIIDDKGNEILKPKYEYIDDFQNGMAIIGTGKDDGSGPSTRKYGAIDKTGTVIVEPQYNFITKFDKEGLAICEVKINGNIRRAGIIDKTGKIIVEPKYEMIKYDATRISARFENGVEIFKTGDTPFDGEYGIIDKTGKVILEPKYYSIGDWQGFTFDGVAPFIKCDYNSKTGKYIFKYGLMDKTGKILIEPKYDKLQSVGDGLVGYYSETAKKWGYIDYKGNVIIKPQFDDVEGFVDGLAYVGDKDTYKIINKQGKTLFKLVKGKVTDDKGKIIYSGYVRYMTCEKGGIIRLLEECSYGFSAEGYINKNGKLIWSPQKSKLYISEYVD